MKQANPFLTPRPRHWRSVVVAVLGCLVCGALTLALTAFSANAAKRPRSVMEGVPALAKPVTYSETKIPLGELIQKVSEDTGVPLSASKEVADEPVAVVVKDLPARVLLEQLAELLDYQWNRRTSAARSKLAGSRLQVKTDPNNLQPANLQPATVFVIWQDLASKQREEAARRALTADVEKRFQEDLALAVEFAAMTPAQLARIRDDQLKRSAELDKLPPEQWRAASNTPEHEEGVRRYQQARRLESPVARTLALLLGRLTGRQWGLLRSGQPLLLATDPQPSEERLPADTGRALRVAQPTLFPPFLPGPVSRSLRARLADPAVAERVAQREKELQDQWSAATGYRVAIWMDPLGGREGAALSLRASAAAIRSGAPGVEPWPAGNFGGAPGTDFSVYTSAVDRGQPYLEDTPERYAALLKDPVLGARKPFKPEAKPPVAAPDPAGAPELTFRDLLPDLARTYGVHFISDSYSPGGLPVAPTLLASPEPAALFTLLDRLTWGSHRWDRVDGGGTWAAEQRGRSPGAGPGPGLIRIRSRHWFLDRPREIPLRLVRRWKAGCDHDSGLPLAEYVAIARDLTDAQLATLPSVIRETRLPSDLSEAVTARYALRLYGALSPAQRELLGRGAALPVVQMTPPQRDLFVVALRDPWRYRFVTINPEQLAHAGLALTTRPLLRTTVKRGGVVLRQTTAPLPPAAGAEPAAPGGSSTGSLAAAPAPGTPGVSSAPAAPRPGATSSAQDTPAEEVTSRPVTEISFILQYGSATPDTVRLTVVRVAR